MIQSIKTLLQEYGIDGDIILYRDEDHRKKKMCEYLVSKMELEGKDVVTYSDGAFAYYLSLAMPSGTVNTYYYIISPDYKEAMENQLNLVLNPGVRKSTWVEMTQEHTDWVVVDQFTNENVKEYYKNYFQTVVDAVKDYTIDAFCDYSHSAMTMAGFIDSELVNWKFIAGILIVNSVILRPQLEQYKDILDVVDVNHFDTDELGVKIEQMYPNFGNVYEATRSISGAMQWLVNNPGKTVLVYVGDEFTRITSQFNSKSLSQRFSKELYYFTNLLNEAQETGSVNIPLLKEYYEFMSEYFDEEHKKYIFDLFLVLYRRRLGRLINPKPVQVLQMLLTIQELIDMKQSTFEMLKIMFTEYNSSDYSNKLYSALNNDMLSGKEDVLDYEVASMLNGFGQITIDSDTVNKLKETVTEVGEYRLSLGFME